MSMELDNSFTVPVPPEVAWNVLLDVASIAPNMPGATVDEVDGDVVTGRIKIKVGPVALTYRGTAKFTERDDTTHTILVDASGKETRGAGTATATIKATLRPADDGATLVTMHTTMNVTGRPAQFGRGVMLEVAGKLVDKFAENLAAQLAGDSAAGTTAASTATARADAAGGTSGAVATDTSAADGASGSAGSSEANGASGADGTSGAVGTTMTSGSASDSADAGRESTAGVAAATAAAAATPAREDSINLVRLVGPAILKRVIPVAAVAAAVALLGNRIRRALRRSGKD
jgi:carbon monoxide dehydrogenase subunit G